MNRIRKLEDWDILMLRKSEEAEPWPLEAEPRPVCHDTERCEGCGYPGHGFVCHGADGCCLRAEIEKIYERRRRKDDEHGTEQ